MTADLGVFAAAELRAGGFNDRGFLQPMLSVPDDVDIRVEARAAAEDLASRGLLVRRAGGWRPVGRYERVLEAAAVARSLVVLGPASPNAAGFTTPRLVLARLGTTDEVLDLQPVGEGYHARLLEVAAAAAELAEVLAPAAGAPALEGAPAAGGSAVSDLDPAWSRVEALLARGVATIRVEAASVLDPAQPLFQHRVTLMSTSEGPWLLLGTRQGGQFSRVAAVAAPPRARRLLEGLLRGTLVAL